MLVLRMSLLMAICTGLGKSICSGNEGTQANTYNSSAAVDSPKVPWDAVKSLVMNEPSDILLLLDCCALPDDSANGENGVKQALAACAPDTAANEPGPNSFTYHLIDALHKLSSGPPFTAQQLHEELNVSIQALKSIEQNAGTNGDSKEATPSERAPVFFSLTPGNPKNIVLTPMHDTNQPIMPSMDGYDHMMHDRPAEHYPPPLSPALLFDEPRALVSIQFQDEFGHEMVTFKQWLNSIPGTSTTVTVEGKFQGPATVLIMSMPTEIYSAISQERQCIFLAYVKSHNMVKEHQSLVDLAMLANQASNQASSKQLEDGKMLLDAASSLAAVSSPGLNKLEPQTVGPQGMNAYEQSPNMLSRNMILTAAQKEVLTPQQADLLRSLGMKDHESEMHEAAVQLKALSHVRPPSHDNSGSRHERGQSHGHLLDDQNHSPNYHSPRQHSISSHHQQGTDMNEHSDIDGDLYAAGSYSTPSTSRAKPRKSLTKSVGAKTDTRCSMCSHAPFKDSSSLRKHIAAAHTRPFPCAFAFAGCNSTFGSKNEWKRHIASQHLCLTFYRCSSCPQSQTEGKGNEFNRKDLFTQHLRRMHAPFAIKKQRGQGDNRLLAEWENHVKSMQADCLVHRRQPPQRSACPKEDCVTVFEGAGSWDDWTEHVGRHMEKGEAGRLGVDSLLADWALGEGIIEMRGGEYRLVGSEREQSGGYFSDGQGQGREMGGQQQGVKRELEEMERGGGEEMIAEELR